MWFKQSKTLCGNLEALLMSETSFGKAFCFSFLVNIFMTPKQHLAHIWIIWMIQSMIFVDLQG